jgi:hypothetical protein
MLISFERENPIMLKTSFPVALFAGIAGALMMQPQYFWAGVAVWAMSLVLSTLYTWDA